MAENTAGKENRIGSSEVVHFAYWPINSEECFGPLDNWITKGEDKNILHNFIQNKNSQNKKLESTEIGKVDFVTVQAAFRGPTYSFRFCLINNAFGRDIPHIGDLDRDKAIALGRCTSTIFLITNNEMDNKESRDRMSAFMRTLTTNSLSGPLNPIVLIILNYDTTSVESIENFASHIHKVCKQSLAAAITVPSNPTKSHMDRLFKQMLCVMDPTIPMAKLCENKMPIFRVNKPEGILEVTILSSSFKANGAYFMKHGVCGQPKASFSNEIEVLKSSKKKGKEINWVKTDRNSQLFVLSANNVSTLDLGKLGSSYYCVRFFQDGFFGSGPGGFIEIPFKEILSNEHTFQKTFDLDVQPQKKEKVTGCKVKAEITFY